MKMNSDGPTTYKLDRIVECTRHVLVVLFATLGSYWSLLLASPVILPWAFLVIGGALLYVLFLPYKHAMLIEGDPGIIARIRVVKSLLIGLPMWLVPTIAIILYPSLAQALPDYLNNVESNEFFRLLKISWLGVFLSFGIAFSRLWPRILTALGHDEDDSNSLTRYVKSTGFYGAAVTSLLVFYVVNFIAAGWLHHDYAETATHYYSAAVTLLLLLMWFGLFYAWYIPERCKWRCCKVLEMLILLSVLLAPHTIYLGATLTAILILLLAALTWKCKSVQVDDVVKEMDEELEKSWVMKLFKMYYEQHPTVFRVLACSYMVCFLAVYLWDILLAPVSVWLLISLIAAFLGSMILVPLAWALRRGKLDEFLE